MAYSIPNQCTVCNDTLLGPPPPSALVMLETDVHNNVRCYHKSCIERLARIAQSLDMHGPFYGVNASNGPQGASRPQLQYNKDVDSDDDIQKVRDTAAPSTPPTGYLRTPYTNETFDDRRDKVIAELRLQLGAMEKTLADGPSYIAQAVRKALTEAMVEYRSGRIRFDEDKGEWITR